jgi:RNA polymerase sigma-70 factor (ECF subfamily)
MEGKESFQSDLVALLPRLRRFALAMTGSHADAEDLVQSAVLRALRRQETWQPGTRLDSWMFKIMQNLWRDDLRAMRRRKPHVELTPALPGEDGRVVTAGLLDLGDVTLVLSTLPREQRTVMALVVLDGMSYAEAADALGVPVGTVMSRLARARAALAARLAPTPTPFQDVK